MSNNQSNGSGALPDLTIRLADDADTAAVQRLAELDSTSMPRGPVLLALVGGAPRAAWAIAEHRAIADPFRPTAHLIDLLERRARDDADGAVRARIRLGGGVTRRSAPWPA